MFDLFRLQFFADGGATGGEGGAEGVTAGDPGQQNSLESLGVPKDKAERYRARKAKYAAKAAAAETQAQSEEPAEEKPAAAPAQSAWDEFMKDPDNNARMQKTIKDRLKEQGKKHEEYMAKLSPALELLASKYNLEAVDGKIDPEALAKAITSDSSYYEGKALELGVDEETAKRILELERDSAQLEKMKQAQLQQQQEEERDNMLREHFNAMQRQADDLRNIFPDFDLQRELQNPEFYKRTAPGGMSVKEAVYSLHGDEILEKQAAIIAQRTKVDVANSIRSGKNHPRENGSLNAAVSTRPDMQKMTREDRLQYIKKKYSPK